MTGGEEKGSLQRAKKLPHKSWIQPAGEKKPFHVSWQITTHENRPTLLLRTEVLVTTSVEAKQTNVFVQHNTVLDKAAIAIVALYRS